MNDSYPAAIVCPHCAIPIDSTGRPSARRSCPNCGEAIQHEDAVSWTNVARVGNLAEAGFLTDELIGMGIQARVHQLDDFNAITDRWTSLYLIQVSPEDAERAAAQIQQHRDEDLQRRAGEHSASSLLSSHILDPLFWRPVALVVLTGIACFVIGQRLSGNNPARSLRANSLPATANQIGQPFVTEPVAGQPRYRLSFDPQQQAWSLESDRDNDGRYDTRRQFHATGAAW